MERQTKIGEKYLGKLDIESPDVQQRLGKGKILTHISLFTGVGGFDLGFAKAGIQTRAMIEWDKNCCKTLRANWHWEELKKRKNSDGTLKWKTKEEFLNEHRIWKDKVKGYRKINGSDAVIPFKLEMEAPVASWYDEREPVIIQKDITKTTTKEILEAAELKVGECSIISGGFPCQGFSTAGRRVRDDPRNFLYREFVRIVDEAKPAMMIGENVPGIVSMGKGEVMKQICEDFANAGYDVTWDILNAADYGVPQNRKRVFLIGFRCDLLKMEGEMPSFHIGVPGTIKHPALFKERLKRWKRKDLLEEFEKDLRVEFEEKRK